MRDPREADLQIVRSATAREAVAAERHREPGFLSLLLADSSARRSELMTVDVGEEVLCRARGAATTRTVLDGSYVMWTHGSQRPPSPAGGWTSVIYVSKIDIFEAGSMLGIGPSLRSPAA